MRFVKIFVVVAGLVLIFGTTLLVVLLVKRARLPVVDVTEARPLVLPRGMRFVDVAAGADVLVLRLEDAAGVPHLLVIDRDRGRTTAFWRLDERP